MARKDKEIEDARRRDVESDENKREKRERERKTDEYLARLQQEERGQ